METPGIGSVENMEKRPGCSRTFGIEKVGYAIGGLKYMCSTENFRKLFLQINQSCSTLIYFIQSKVSLKKNGGNILFLVLSLASYTQYTVLGAV